MNRHIQALKKHCFTVLMTGITWDGYRRTLANDRAQRMQEVAKAREEAADQAIEQANKEYLQKLIEDSKEKTEVIAATGRNQEAAKDYQVAADAFLKDPSEYKKKELDRVKNKLDKTYEEVKDLNDKNKSIFEYFDSLYLNYTEFLDTLTPDKILCLFNIIIGVVTLSTFLPLISILFSEKIISKLKFLDKFPIILAILRIRNTIKKELAIVYLISHFFIIL
jgi:hypothetical protein